MDFKIYFGKCKAYQLQFAYYLLIREIFNMVLFTAKQVFIGNTVRINNHFKRLLLKTT